MNNLRKIKDNELLNHFSRIVTEERRNHVEVILHMAEISRRGLHLKEGYSSLFTYVVEKYHYSEGGAYRRIQAAKAVQIAPEMIALLKSGQLNLAVISLITPHLTPKNRVWVIAGILGKSKREVEYFIATQFEKKKDGIRDRIVKLPAQRKAAELNFSREASGEAAGEVERKKRASAMPADPSPAVSSPPALPIASDIRGNFAGEVNCRKNEQNRIPTEQRVKIEFSASETLAKKIERAKALLRHKYPKARLEDIFDEALEALLDKKAPERKIARISSKLLQSKSAQSDSKAESEASGGARRNSKRSFAPSALRMTARYIPQDVRRKVWNRDQGACVYQSPNGKRCGERAFLEADHVRAFALGGKSTVENLQLLCRAHNQYRAQQTFGIPY